MLVSVSIWLILSYLGEKLNKGPIPAFKSSSDLGNVGVSDKLVDIYVCIICFKRIGDHLGTAVSDKEFGFASSELILRPMKRATPWLWFGDSLGDRHRGSVVNSCIENGSTFCLGPAHDLKGPLFKGPQVYYKKHKLLGFEFISVLLKNQESSLRG